MRHSLSLCATLTMALVGAKLVWAADVDIVYAPPRPVAAPFAIWTGCFVGFNVGGLASKSELSETSPGTSSAANSDQALAGGAQIGCDYQAGPWVLGVQGMLDGAGLRGGATPQFPGVVGTATFPKGSWFSTATGRVGYTVQPAVLLYLKGGGAWARTGWVAGAGLEWQFLPNASIFVEYDYLRFESKNVTFATIPPLSASASLNQQAILVGANFRFDFGPPVTTRY
jgi:outer membrane immunogenic protein